MKKTKKQVKKVVKKVIKKPVTIANKIGVEPLNDRILIKPFEAELATTASGIIIPDTVSKEKPEQGEVVAVGEGKWQDGKKIPVSVKVGDKVVFSKYGYDEVKIKGEEYYILREESILAVIKN